MGQAGLIEAGRRALGLLFQRPCLLCGGRAGDPALGAACGTCWEALDALPVPVTRFAVLEAPAFDAAMAAFPYEGGLRELVHAYKFEGHPSLRRPLARRLARRCEGAAGACDAVVALPASPQSLRERGYDAAGELAQDAAQAWGLPLLRPLRWARPHVRQSELKARQRLANARGAFLAHGEEVKGRRLLLVDDLLSSGATADAAATALKRAGAVSVAVAALAHALSDN